MRRSMSMGEGALIRLCVRNTTFLPDRKRNYKSLIEGLHYTCEIELLEFALER